MVKNLFFVVLINLRAVTGLFERLRLLPMAIFASWPT